MTYFQDMKDTTVNLLRSEPGETTVDKVRRAIFWLVIIAALVVVYAAGTTLLGANT